MHESNIHACVNSAFIHAYTLACIHNVDPMREIERDIQTDRDREMRCLCLVNQLITFSLFYRSVHVLYT